MSKRGVWSYEDNGTESIWTRAVLVNEQPAVMEVRFNFLTKTGYYVIRLARSGFTVWRDGGLEWDDLNRKMSKTAWLLGEREVARVCGVCGGTLYRMPLRAERRVNAALRVSFAVHLCTKCGRTWESEFKRLHGAALERG